MVVHRCPCLNVAVHAADEVRPLSTPQTPEGSSQSSLSSSIASKITEFVVAEEIRTKGIIKAVGKGTVGMGGVKKEFEELSSVHQLSKTIRIYRCDNCLTNFMATCDELPQNTILLNMDLLVGNDAYEIRSQHEKYSKAFRIILDEQDSVSPDVSLSALKDTKKIEGRLQAMISDSESIEKRIMHDRIEAFTHKQQILFKKFQSENVTQKQTIIQRAADANRKKITITAPSSNVQPMIAASSSALSSNTDIASTKSLSNLASNITSPSSATTSQKMTISTPPLPAKTIGLTKLMPTPSSPRSQNSTVSKSVPKTIGKQKPRQEESGSVFSFEEEAILEEEMKSRGQLDKYIAEEDEEEPKASSKTSKGQPSAAVTQSQGIKHTRGGSQSGTTALGSSLPISIPANVGRYADDSDEEEVGEGKERLMPHQIAESMYENAPSFGSSRRNIALI